jgi:hypothetical protein
MLGVRGVLQQGVTSGGVGGVTQQGGVGGAVQQGGGVGGWQHGGGGAQHCANAVSGAALLSIRRPNPIRKPRSVVRVFMDGPSTGPSVSYRYGE